MPVDTATRQLLDLLASLGLPDPATLPPAEVRSMFAADESRPPGPALARVEDLSVPGPAGDIPLRLYAREGIGDGAPILVYYHGGGWVIGDLESHDPTCRSLADVTGALVIAVDYRLAPEHPFPASPEDCYAALVEIGRKGTSLGGDPGRLAVCGDSAGGNLSAVVSQMARDRGGPRIAAQVLVYPVTDADFDTPSYLDNAEGYLLTRPFMAWFWGHYVTDPARRRDPSASPLRASDLRGLPPALVITAEFDPLRDEGEAYAASLDAAGVPTTCVRYNGQIHTFFTQVDILPVGQLARRQVADFLAAAWAG